MGETFKSTTVDPAWAEVTISAPDYIFRSVPSRDIDGCADVRAFLAQRGMRERIFIEVNVQPSYSNRDLKKHGFRFVSFFENCTWDSDAINKPTAKDLWKNEFTEIVKDLMYKLEVEAVTVYFHDIIKQSAILIMKEN